MPVGRSGCPMASRGRTRRRPGRRRWRRSPGRRRGRGRRTPARPGRAGRRRRGRAPRPRSPMVGRVGVDEHAHVAIDACGDRGSVAPRAVAQLLVERDGPVERGARWSRSRVPGRRPRRSRSKRSWPVNTSSAMPDRVRGHGRGVDVEADERQRRRPRSRAARCGRARRRVQRHRSSSSPSSRRRRSCGEQERRGDGPAPAHERAARRRPASRRGTRRRPRSPTDARQVAVGVVDGRNVGVTARNRRPSRRRAPHQRGLARVPRRRAGGAGVADGERVQQRVALGVADLVGEAADRAVVAEVASGRGVGEQQVVAHHPRQLVGPGFVEADADRDRARDLDPHDRVVAGLALGDVVEQRGEEQHVAPRARGRRRRRSRHPAGRRVEERRALGHRLERVPVDGEAVVGVALRPCPHVRPLGEQPHQQPDVVEGLEHRDRAAPGGEQVDERGRGRRRPTRRPVAPRAGSARARSNGTRSSRRVRGGAQHGRRVERRVGSERDPPVTQHDAVAEVAAGAPRTGSGPPRSRATATRGRG